MAVDLTPCGVFDWTKPRHLDTYFGLHQPMADQGVDGWWLDWCCDESSANAPGLTADTWINSQYAAFSREHGSRWLTLSRMGGSNKIDGFGASDGGDNGAPGAFAEHRSTIHFTGDTSATWEMLAFVAKLTADEGSIGLPYVSHDIGSFHGTSAIPQVPGPWTATVYSKLPPDMYARWMQLGAFQPIDRLHSNHGARLPWEYSGDAREAGTKFLRLRGALVPYLYTLAREAHDTGLPMARHLYLEWAELDEAYQHPTQYLLGKDLLVAPVTTGGNPATTSVWFPPGTWVDYFTGERFTGPKTVSMSVPLTRMPVFLRAGSVLVTQPAAPTTADGPQDGLVVTATSGAGGSFELYDDAGAGFGYEAGEFTRTPITHALTSTGSRVTIGAAKGTFPSALAARRWEVRFTGVAAPTAVTVDEVAVPATSASSGQPGWWYDSATRTVHVRTSSLPTTEATVVRVVS